MRGRVPTSWAWWSAYSVVMRCFTVVQAHGGVSGIKGALRALGLPGGVPRRPRLEVPEPWVAAILEAVDTLGLRASEGI